MKRPQSANYNKKFWAQASKEDIDLTVQTPNRVFIKAGNKAVFNPMTASNDLTRMLPKKIQQDKERLYCQTLQLKNNLNEVSQQNLRLKTKIATLQRQKDRLNKTEQPTLSNVRAGNYSNLNSKGEKENGMVINLKKMVREARQQNESHKSEIAKIKRTIRYTKINELEIQKITFVDQNKRLAKVIQQLEMQLSTRVRQDEQIKQIQAELHEKQTELNEVTADNMKYQEILQDMQMKNKEVTERLLLSQRKWQRDISVQKRKIEQLNLQIDLLKHQVKILTERVQEQKKKGANENIKIERPVSSRPYQKMDSNNLKNKAKEKEQALQKNQKLKQQIEVVKRRLAESQNQLKIKVENKQKDQLAASKDQTFELILTKNQVNQFIRHDEDQEYKTDFDQSPKTSNIFNELPLQQKSKQKKGKQPIKNNSKSASPIINQIRQILTYRMRYNRYPFDQLKGDIQASPLSTFNYEDLMSMLQSEPFFLTKNYAQQFLKVCFGRKRLDSNDYLQSSVLLKNLRAVIDDFQLLDEQQQERMLYKIAEFMTKHRSELQNEFKKVRDRQNCINKAELVKVLGKWGQMSEQQMNLAICYISINAQTLQAFSYVDLLDRFYINSSKQFSNTKSNNNHFRQEQLSMGENEYLQEGELIGDDELV